MGEALYYGQEERPEGERGWLSRQKTHSLCKGPVVGGLGLLQELKKAENHLDLATESRGLCINHNLDIINQLL